MEGDIGVVVLVEDGEAVVSVFLFTSALTGNPPGHIKAAVGQ